MMERHIQRRIHDLDEERMRRSLTKLKSDLGISSNSSPPTKHAALLIHDKHHHNSPREVKSSSMTSVFSSNVSAVQPPNEPDSAHEFKEALATTLQAGKPSDVTDDVSVTSQRKISAGSSKVASKPVTPQKSPREGVKSPNVDLNKTFTTGSAVTSSNRKLSATASDDESDYQSVADLSMALKPGVKLSVMKQKRSSAGSAKSSKREESSDIFTNSESTVKEVAPTAAKVDSNGGGYSDDDFDDDF